MLASLALNDDSTIVIAGAGVIAVVLTAMTAHAGNADVQEMGCAVLANLADNDENQILIAGAGGIGVVLTAMTTHTGNEFHEYGCEALGNLGQSDVTLQKRIKDEGGVGVVEVAVGAVGATAGCKKYGQTLLDTLASV